LIRINFWFLILFPRLNNMARINERSSVSVNSSLTPRVNNSLSLLEFPSSNEKCARCKTLNAFQCEHKTTIRDHINTIYAQEGRFYLHPRKSRRTSQDATANDAAAFNSERLRRFEIEKPIKASSKSPTLKSSLKRNDPAARATPNAGLVVVNNDNNYQKSTNSSENNKKKRFCSIL
jgi:hypothetical protein